MCGLCFEIIYRVLLIVQKGHSAPDGQRAALNVRPLQSKRFFLSNQTLVGAIGYSDYEPYEGDKDSVQVVYSALRLGSVYRFDTDSRYEVVETNKYGTTALTTVVYQDGANVEPVNNWGILSYNNEKECFVAVELESNFVSEEQALEIAKSIEF